MVNYIIVNGELYHSDELMHRSYKYIKKEMVDGKMRYYYERKPGLGFPSTTYVKDTPGEYGEFRRVNIVNPKKITINRTKSNDIFSKTHTSFNEDGSITNTESVGLLEQKLKTVIETADETLEKAKKWLENLYL